MNQYSVRFMQLLFSLVRAFLSHRRIVRCAPSIAMMAIACLGSLFAQVPIGWAPLRTAQEVVPCVGFKLVPVAGAYQLHFKNFGANPVHFNFFLRELQTTDSIQGNGRVHLKAGNLIGPIQVLVTPGGTEPITVEALDFSSGYEN